MNEDFIKDRYVSLCRDQTYLKRVNFFYQTKFVYYDFIETLSATAVGGKFSEAFSFKEIMY